MTRFTTNLVAGLCIAVLVGVLSAGSGQARQWNPSPETAARDYVMIQHDINETEFLMIMWFAPPLIPIHQEGAAEAREILDQYLLLGIAHLRVDTTTGLMSSVLQSFPNVVTDRGQSITEIDTGSIPPVPLAVLTAVSSIFTQNLGAVGEQFEWRIYDGSRVSACGKGTFFMSYLGTDYDFQTPIPGC